MLAAVAAAFVFWPAPPAPVFDPPSLDFGEQRKETAGAARQVKLTNTGERKLEILGLDGAGGDFQVVDEDCSGAALAPGEDCSYAIVFAPTQAGPRTGEILLVANAEGRLQLTGLGTAPALRFGSSAVDFGRRPVGGRSTGAAVALVNAGSAPLALGRVTIEGEDQDDFSLIGRCGKKVIAIGEGCDFRVAFAPRASGERRAFLQVASDSSSEPERLLLHGQGAWEGPEVASDPSGLVFSVLKVGRKSAEKEVTLTNRSEESVVLSRVVVEDESSGFVVAGENCVAATLLPGEGCKIRMTFAPKVAGLVSSILLARQEGGGGSSIPLRGAGALPELRLDPASLDFRSIREGFESAPLTLEMISEGRVPLVVESVGLIGAEAGSAFEIRDDGCSRSTLGPGKKCEVVITFRPQSEGDAEAELRIRSDARGGARVVAVRGRGVAPKLVLEPGRLDFGSVVRTQDAIRHVVIANRGEASLEIQGLEVGGAAAGDYRIEDIDCTLDRGLAPGSECRIRIRFAPTRDGARDAGIAIRHGTVGKVATIALRGRGLAPEPRLRVEPSRVGFPTVNVGERSPIVTVTLYNDGEGSLSLRGVTVGGDDAADFLIIPSTCSGIPRIAPKSSCTLGLRFVPALEGMRRGVLEIRHDGPHHDGRVELEGRASGGLVGP